MREPLAGLLLKRTWVYEDASAPVPAYTDGLRIYINPQLFFNYDPDERTAIMLHELMHIMLKHVPRGEAVKRVRNVPHIVVNIAADVKANQYIDTRWFKLPKDVITAWTVAGLLDKSVSEVERLSFEELVDLLSKYSQYIVQHFRLYQTGDLREVPSPTSPGRVLNEGDPGDEGASGEELERRVERKVAEVVMTARLAGALPGWAERALKEILKPKINWRKVLRFAISKGLGKKVRRTWSRPSKKVPEMFPGKDFLKLNKVLALVDVSGSIDDKTLTRFLSEVYWAAKEAAEVIVIAWDAKVQGEFTIRRPSDVRRIKITGRGGTLIRPALELAEKKYGGNSLWVIFSDWEVGDLTSAEPVLRRNARRIVAVTTYRKPPSYLPVVIEVRQ